MEKLLLKKWIFNRKRNSDISRTVRRPITSDAIGLKLLYLVMVNGGHFEH